MFDPRRRRLTAGSLALLACAVTATTPGVARANTYRQILCANPATGERVLESGLPDGMDNPASYPMMSGASCGPGGISIQQAETTNAPHTGGALRYRAGAVTFRSAELFRSWSGSSAWGLFVNRGPVWSDMWASPWNDRCSSNYAYGCTSRGASSPRFGAANRVTIVAGEESTNGFNLAVLCDASNLNPTCGANGAHGLTLYGGTVTLEDTGDPQVASVPGGDLYDDAMANAALSGTKELTVSATDAGPASTAFARSSTISSRSRASSTTTAVGARTSPPTTTIRTSSATGSRAGPRPAGRSRSTRRRSPRGGTTSSSRSRTHRGTPRRSSIGR